MLVIISFHEFGHYYAARKVGVHVEIFSIGMGPEIFSFKTKSGTKFRIGALPVGGYVKMFGEDEQNQLSQENKEKSFFFKPIWAKSVIVASGPIANFLMAIFILTCFNMIYGKIQHSAKIHEVLKDSPAADAGLLSGDVILEVDGFAINDFADFQNVILIHPEIPLQITFRRNDEIMKNVISPKATMRKDFLGHETKVGTVGIVAGEASAQKLSFAASLFEAAIFVKQTCHLTLKFLGNLISHGTGIENMGGPIKIAQYSGKSAQAGYVSLIWLIAILSINLGLINLLPIPMLDGGHLFLYLIEAISRRKISPKIQDFAFKMGALFLISTMLYFTFHDIRSLFL